LQGEHGFDMRRHCLHRTIDIFIRILATQRQRLFERHSVRHITIERIVGARLIRKKIGKDATLYDFRQDISAIANKSH